MADDDDLRHAAVGRIKARRGFTNFLIGAVILSLLMIVIWLFTGGGYFWPIWPMLGFAIGLAFMAWSAFGPGSKPISSDEVDREMNRMRGDDD